ncbi:xanthine dehydrogenase family protein molybdopterin-binding subunit [Leekyejoonella antrihumi]|uniref:Xanthine dehydrogenase family protein molybdopterin-binding subunit n=1 Tax=Leekyejoonella antrihumi TaxID=1660198 RepID=A0A563E2K9_9MICO|nr:xanthine dehydrogenase family protein molybdopterin-binding subunit [Leekyejoonella antrihumi]TWP36780.1 xanthine dehydrogenase family protein molybdopterin-binding subunit [Leekyejoonella antrihumi]
MTATDERPAEQAHEIGTSRTRKEDQHLITGHSTWVDNMVLPGMVHLAILRSPMAHAKITSIDASGARKYPGVVAAFTGADFADTQGNLPCAWPVTPDMVNPGAPSLAVEQVNFAGDAVAVVAARTKAEAVDALESIEVEYDPLPPVLDLEAALADGSTLVHPNTTSNKCYTWVFDSADAGSGASMDDARRDAEVTVTRRFIQQRLSPSYMEPRSTLVQPVDQGVTIWSSTQIPHILRTMLALTLGIPEHKVRAIAPDVGGGFGGKITITPEEVITTLVARRLGKPAKYTETRSETLEAAHHGRAQIQDITITAKQDGTVTGLDVHLTADLGAYLRLITPGIPLLGAFMYPGIYKFPAYHLSCDGVFTTKVPTDAYRGAGRPEATFAIERIMDELAAELKMDPLALRRKNWIAHEEFPFTTVAGLTYDTGNYEAATDKAVELVGWEDLRAEQARRREAKDPVQLGLGVSTFTEMCGIAPSRVLGSLSFGSGGWENASIRMLPTGKVEVVTGISPHGQGHETGFSQIVADRLGIPFDDIEIIHGDTQSSPKGLDTYGSRSLSVGGIAVVKAVDKVIEKARRVAAHMLEASQDDLEFEAGSFSVKGAPGSSVSLPEIAFAVFVAHDLPDGMEPSLNSEATYDPVNFSFPHGTHLCATEVDTETGRVKILKYACVDDVGTPINPLLIDGQVHGGLAQGIAQALYEEAVYDDAGNLVTGTFVDYTLPAAPDLPNFLTDRTVTPSTDNPLGVKGVGEAGTIASTPAVVNAIVDALRPLGINNIQMPCTPERVWRAIQSSGANDQGSAAASTQEHFDSTEGDAQ